MQQSSPGSASPGREGHPCESPTLSDELEAWLTAEGEQTLASLLELFGNRGFAVVFVLLLGVPALPLPTGGATHVFEIVAMLLALELIVGRQEVWLPRRWRTLELGGQRQHRFMHAMLRMIRWLERFSRPRLRFLFHHRLSNVVFGVLVVGGAAGAFLAPPFTGLDTLPALGVVLLSLAVLLEDFLLVLVGLVVGAVGVALEIVLASAVVHGLGSFL